MTEFARSNPTKHVRGAASAATPAGTIIIPPIRCFFYLVDMVNDAAWNSGGLIAVVAEMLLESGAWGFPIDCSGNASFRTTQDTWFNNVFRAATGALPVYPYIIRFRVTNAIIAGICTCDLYYI